LSRVSDEPRTLDFEIKTTAAASGKLTNTAFALLHFCDEDGTCRFLHLALPIEITIRK
jgi:hypothetical protein